MPFPYMYPVGALLATLLLGATLTIFAVALKALDRAVTRVGDSILSGLVSGFHGWYESQPDTIPPVSAGAGETVDSSSPIAVEPVHRR